MGEVKVVPDRFKFMAGGFYVSVLVSSFSHGSLFFPLRAVEFVAAVSARRIVRRGQKLVFEIE